MKFRFPYALKEPGEDMLKLLVAENDKRRYDKKHREHSSEDCDYKREYGYSIKVTEAFS